MDWIMFLPRPVRRCTTLMLVWMMVITTMMAGPRDHQFPLSVSYGIPSGALTTRLDAAPGFGISLGYAYHVDRNLAIGAAGIVERMLVSIPSTTVLSMYQCVATMRYRFIKHGWSPFVQVEGGLALSDADAEVDSLKVLVTDMGTTSWTAAARVGVLIPVSPQVDLDVHGRIGRTWMSLPLTSTSIHAGIVLRRP